MDNPFSSFQTLWKGSEQVYSAYSWWSRYCDLCLGPGSPLQLIMQCSGQHTLAAAERISVSPQSGISAGNPLVPILKRPKSVSSMYTAGDSPIPRASKPTSVEVASPPQRWAPACRHVGDWLRPGSTRPPRDEPRSHLHPPGSRAYHTGPWQPTLFLPGLHQALGRLCCQTSLHSCIACPLVFGGVICTLGPSFWWDPSLPSRLSLEMPSPVGTRLAPRCLSGSDCWTMIQLSPLSWMLSHPRLIGLHLATASSRSCPPSVPGGDVLSRHGTVVEDWDRPRACVPAYLFDFTRTTFLLYLTLLKHLS
jgi:hypothetical protein